jgi:uncharacterized protein
MNPLINFVKQEVGNDKTGHSFLHAERVAKLAKEIALQEGGNLKIIEASAYLHDCADEKLFKDPALQIEKIRKFLKDNNYTLEEIDSIIYIITHISWHLEVKEKEPLETLEASIVRDADRLEALGAIGIIRCIEYGSRQGRDFYNENDIKRYLGEEVPSSNPTSLSHFYDKLLKLGDHFKTKTGREMAKQRIAFLHEFLNEFYQELNINKL